MEKSLIPFFALRGIKLYNNFDKFSQKFDTSHVDFNNVETFGDLYKQLRGWDFKCVPSKIKIGIIYHLAFCVLDTSVWLFDPEEKKDILNVLPYHQ